VPNGQVYDQGIPSRTSRTLEKFPFHDEINERTSMPIPKLAFKLKHRIDLFFKSTLNNVYFY
jgi:hypothetical protein